MAYDLHLERTDIIPASILENNLDNICPVCRTSYQELQDQNEELLVDHVAKKVACLNCFKDWYSTQGSSSRCLMCQRNCLTEREFKLIFLPETTNEESQECSNLTDSPDSIKADILSRRPSIEEINLVIRINQIALRTLFEQNQDIQAELRVANNQLQLQNALAKAEEVKDKIENLDEEIESFEANKARRLKFQGIKNSDLTDSAFTHTVIAFFMAITTYMCVNLLDHPKYKALEYYETLAVGSGIMVATILLFAAFLNSYDQAGKMFREIYSRLTNTF